MTCSVCLDRRYQAGNICTRCFYLRSLVFVHFQGVGWPPLSLLVSTLLPTPSMFWHATGKNMKDLFY